MVVPGWSYECVYVCTCVRAFARVRVCVREIGTQTHCCSFADSLKTHRHTAKRLCCRRLFPGADHHHVHLRQSERLGGARLPLCSQGSHHPVPASEKRGLAAGHRQPLQCHGVCLCLCLCVCLGSQLQLLQRYAGSQRCWNKLVQDLWYQQQFLGFFFLLLLVCNRAAEEGNFRKSLFFPGLLHIRLKTPRLSNYNPVITFLVACDKSQPYLEPINKLAISQH